MRRQATPTWWIRLRRFIKFASGAPAGADRLGTGSCHGSGLVVDKGRLAHGGVAAPGVNQVEHRPERRQIQRARRTTIKIEN
jgi:hypothetical protein